MKEQFNHKLFSSFYLWLDNYILDKGEGYVNKASVRLLRQKDNAAPMTYSWASPHQHWVWDTGVTGSNKVTIYTSSGNKLDQNSGIKFDYINGRVLSNNDWGPVLTGNYAKKEFNIYMAEDDEVDLFLERTFDNKDLPRPSTGLPPYQFVAPCVILTLTNGNNQPFAFGGQDITKASFRTFVISNDKFNKQAIESLSQDAARTCFTLIPSSEFPINEFGDVKGTGYSYKNLQNRYNNKDAYIHSVETIKIGEQRNNNTNFSLSLIEFDVEIIRFPHQN